MDLADDHVQAHVHQIQGPLQVLDMRAGRAQVIFPQPVEAAQLTHLLVGDETRHEQAVTMQHGVPLAVLHVALAPGHVAGMGAVEDGHLQAAGLQQVVQRDPVNAGGFHGHVDHALVAQVDGRQFEVIAARAKAAHFGTAGTGDEDLLLADINGPVAGLDLLNHMFFWVVPPRPVEKGKAILPNGVPTRATQAAPVGPPNKQSQAQEQVSRAGKNAPSEALSRCASGTLSYAVLAQQTIRERGSGSHDDSRE